MESKFIALDTKIMKTDNFEEIKAIEPSFYKIPQTSKYLTAYII